MLIPIALAVVAVCIASAVFFPGKTSHKYDNWIEFTLLTVVLFGYLLKWYWRSIKSAEFWALYFVLLLTHSLLFVPIFAYVGRVPVIWFGILAAFEGSLLTGVVSWFLQRGPRI